MRAGAATVVLIALALGAESAHAGGLTIGTGASVDLGTGMLDTGGGDIDVAGTLSAGTQGFDTRHVTIQATGVLNGNSAQMNVCGDWSNAGTFNAGTSSVAFVDGCGVTSSTITGANSFNNLSLTTSIGKPIFFTAGQTTTVNGALALAGTSGNLLQIRSTVSGSEAFLNVQGSSSADFVDVQDSDATVGNAITLGPNSIVGPNTAGWNFGLGVPSLSLLGLGVLGASLYLTGHWTLSRRARADA